MASVILPIQLRTLHHTRCLLLSPFQPPTPTPPPFSRSRRITDVSSFALRPSHQVSFESGAPFLQNSIVCRPAWGCLRGLSLQEPPFFVLFSSPQRSIISMTVTREEGEIKQNGPFKKYYFIMDSREEKRFRIQKLHCRGRVRECVGVRIQLVSQLP